MAQEENVNREWSFDINLSGIEAPSGKGGQRVPEGFYKVQITDMYTKADKPERIIIKCVIADGPFKGQVRTDGLRLPRDANDNVRYYWRALAEAVGFAPSQLDSGSITFAPATFVSKYGGVHYTPGKEGAAKGSPESYDSITWLAPTEWSAQKAAFEGATAPAAASVATGASILDQLGRAPNA